MDQFTYAERATDWRGNNNIAESIFEQLALERHPVPAWVVVGAGTGGTSATIGRYAPLPAAAHPAVRRRPGELGVLPGLARPATRRRDRRGLPDRGHRPATGGAVVRADHRRPDDPGAGRRLAGRDAASSERATGRRAGGSTGTNLWGAFQLVAEMLAAGRTGSVVTLLCDGGERYADTYYSDDWVAGAGPRPRPARRHAAAIRRDGEWRPRPDRA